MAEEAQSDVPGKAPMSINVFQNIKDAIGSLNPQEMRDHADRPLRLFLYADTEDQYRQMEEFLAPPKVSINKRDELSRILRRASEGTAPSSAGDLEIYFEELHAQRVKRAGNAFAFHPDSPNQTIDDVLKQHPNLAIPLARYIYPFREPVIERIIRKIAKENTLFSLGTALPDIVPFISLPWAITEFASDTAFLTANQIRMAFFLAAASDRVIGYREQRNEIGSIVLGAFGWRAIARELVGKIPMGGGLIPKAAIAYAGTRVVGMSLERYYRIGYGYTRDERRAAYEEALERGKTIAGSLLHGLRQRTS
jgi:hypothetical protein